MKRIPDNLIVLLAGLPLAAALLAGAVLLFHYIQPWLIASWIAGGMLLIFSAGFAALLLAFFRK